VAAHPRLAYQLFFDKHTTAAIAELNRDIRRTLRGTLRDVASPPPDHFLTSRDSFIGAWDDHDEVCFSVPVILWWTDHALNYVFRSPQFHSSRKRRRIIGLSNIA
jgi:hypothetical protein